MADIHRKRLGRTLHAIQLLSYYNLCPVPPGCSNIIGITPHSDEEQGFRAARETFFKDTVRTIFRTDETTNTYNVGRSPFSVFSSHGNLNIPGGIVNNISLASFPHSATLTIYNSNGVVISVLHMAGNPNL